MRKNILSTSIAGAVLALSLGSASAVFAGDDPKYTEAGEPEYSGELRDAWLDGKIETAFALNRHLNPFRIDTEVENGMVYLTGTVESDIDRDLAGQIAMSVEGVREVENKLQVGDDDDIGDDVAQASEDLEGDLEEGSRDFMQAVGDATITATVKSKLLANDNVEGLQIDVDTENNVVTLSGTVESSEISDLAETLAANTENVERVENNLEIVDHPGS